MLGKNRVCWFVTSIQSPSCTRPAYDLNRDNRATSKRRHSKIASVGFGALEAAKVWEEPGLGDRDQAVNGLFL